MKTITVKLQNEQAKDLDKLVKIKQYVSKSELIRELIREKMEYTRKEKLGWLILTEKSLEKDWLSKEDEEAWKNL